MLLFIRIMVCDNKNYIEYDISSKLNSKKISTVYCDVEASVGVPASVVMKIFNLNNNDKNNNNKNNVKNINKRSACQEVLLKYAITQVS